VVLKRVLLSQFPVNHSYWLILGPRTSFLPRRGTACTYNQQPFSPYSHWPRNRDSKFVRQHI